MANICFDDKSQRPDAKALAEALGEAAAPWKKLRRELESEWGELVEDWKFYSRKSGWTMKLLLKKRNLFFVTPRRGSVLITFVFGDRAVSAIENGDFPESVKETLRNARKYVEGRGLGIEVASMEDVEIVLNLVRIKIAN